MRSPPATAAALNEAAIGVGGRLGTTLVVLARSGALGADRPEVSSLQLTLKVAAVVGVVGGILVFALLGPDDPVRTVWDLRDERAAPG